MSDAKRILCVLSDDHQRECREALEKLAGPELVLVYQTDPELGLEQMKELAPLAVVVGMEVGPMEGIEFLAIAMRRHPGFDRPVVVLPRKGDPFPSVVHSRDLGSGRSSTVEVRFEALGEVLRAAIPKLAPVFPPAPAPSPPAPAPPSVSVGRATPETVAKLEQGSEQAIAAWPEVGERPRSRAPLILIAIVLLLAVGVGGYFLLGRKPTGQAPGTGTGAASAPVKPDRPAVAKAEASAPATAPDRGATAPVPDQRASRAPEKVELPAKELVAALAFDRDGEQPKLTPARFAEQAETLARALKANPGARLEVGGHASGEGLPAHNQALGQRRAESVRALLIARGLPADRLIVKSYGDAAPLTSNQTPQGRAGNRRVTLRVLRD